MFHQTARKTARIAVTSLAFRALVLLHRFCFFIGAFLVAASWGFLRVPPHLRVLWCRSLETWSAIGGARARIVLLSCVVVAFGGFCRPYL